MGLLVLAYPTLAPQDLEWIESIRTRYNPQDAAIVGPHITLVFETNIMTPVELTDHARKIADSTRPIDLVFRSVMVMPGIVTAETYLFLVPDEGLSASARLHDRLYSGALSSERRLDIPYVPHITLGRFERVEGCRRLADDLMLRPIAMEARVEGVEVVEYTGESIVTLERVHLGGGVAI